MSKNNAAKNNNNNNTAPKAITKVIDLGKAAPAQDNASLLDRIAALNAALKKSEEEKAALQTRVSTSKARAAKVPTSYDVIQPVFVAIRGSINIGIVDNAILKGIFDNACKACKLTIDKAISEKLVDNTIIHNSVSNMAKAKDKASIEGRIKAFDHMLEQAKALLPLLDKAFVDTCKKSVKAAADKALK
jgi:chorismate mutase